MKKTIWTVSGIALILTAMAVASRGDWHLKRNKRNKLPVGKLSLSEGNVYVDEANRKWVLQPHAKNMFHQPGNTPVPIPPDPYPNVTPAPTYDPDHPNLKFLSPDGRGGSYEAILQPDGSYLLTGKKQGTYNYADPNGFTGYAKHLLMDVLPHLFSSDYDESVNPKPES